MVQILLQVDPEWEQVFHGFPLSILSAFSVRIFCLRTGFMVYLRISLLRGCNLTVLLRGKSCSALSIPENVQPHRHMLTLKLWLLHAACPWRMYVCNVMQCNAMQCNVIQPTSMYNVRMLCMYIYICKWCMWWCMSCLLMLHKICM